MRRGTTLTRMSGETLASGVAVGSQVPSPLMAVTLE